MNNNYLFTSESVTEGHPDKIADQISDAILDYIIEKDTNARVACETLVSNGLCLITGELKTNIYAPMQDIAREVIRQIGYTDAAFGFDYRSAGVMSSIGEQSSDINIGVDKKDGELGAGDQGIMFGYACKETKELMPLGITLAHKLTKKLADVRKSGQIPYLRPDGKAQITIEYENGIVKRVHTVVVSAQHSQSIPIDVLRDDIIEDVIKAVIPQNLLDENTIYLVNPTGRFVIGGPLGDVGLTGRKSVIDSYGGYSAIGGGAFSGKDPTKVDRSAAYMARYIAKNLVAADICEKCTIQLSYAIGISKPLSLMVDTYNTSSFSNEQIKNCIEKIFDLSVSAIIKKLDLLKPIYRETSTYGHFGRDDCNFTWEKTDYIEEIKKELKV